jgi:hypothetical protein
VVIGFRCPGEDGHIMPKWVMGIGSPFHRVIIIFNQRITAIALRERYQNNKTITLSLD